MDLLAERQRMTHDEKVLLILEVEQHPCLFDVDHEDYKNGPVRTEIWDYISTQLGRPGTECCEVWRNMRDTFRKSLAKNPNSNYKYGPYLQFLAEAQAAAEAREEPISPEPKPDAAELKLKVNRNKRARLAKRVAAFIDAADQEEEEEDLFASADGRPPTSDKLFGQLVACELEAMPEGPEKLSLKTRITQLICAAKFPNDTSSPSVDESNHANNASDSKNAGGSDKSF